MDDLLGLDDEDSTTSAGVLREGFPTREGMRDREGISRQFRFFGLAPLPLRGWTADVLKPDIVPLSSFVVRFAGIAIYPEASPAVSRWMTSRR